MTEVRDPVHGYVKLEGLALEIANTPQMQRLRWIKQLGLANLVYPGANHTRFEHSLGAYHMAFLLTDHLGLDEDDRLLVGAAALLHDVGHGPFSHALEHELIEDVHHEEISMLLMRKLNEELNGRLQTAIEIFTDIHPKKFLHQLISGQLDVDRMDYLNRDSFFTGVAEGVIGYDRIIKMLTVHNDELMVEEKAIYSIEKFLVSRRLMYWQVYLHKTVIAAEKMLVHIMQRAKELIRNGIKTDAVSAEMDFFLKNPGAGAKIKQHLDLFCRLDDHDVMATIKNWCNHPDKILATLCRSLVERKLLKVKLQSSPFDETVISEKIKEASSLLGISEKEAEYVVFTGEAINTTYNPADEKIHILFKDGTVKDISQVDNALVQHNLKGAVKKHYFCYLKV